MSLTDDFLKELNKKDGTPANKLTKDFATGLQKQKKKKTLDDIAPVKVYEKEDNSSDEEELAPVSLLLTPNVIEQNTKSILDTGIVGSGQASTMSQYDVTTPEKEEKKFDPITAGELFKWGGLKLSSGLASFNKGITSTVNVILGKPLEALGWKNNPINKLADYYSDSYNVIANASEEAEKEIGDNKFVNFLGDSMEAMGSAVPHAILALMTAGTSAAGSATTAGVSATSSALTTNAALQSGNILTKAGLTTSAMLKNPQYWMSFAQSYGSDYEEAIANGASEEMAALGATFTSLINSGIEIGGDGLSGIQGLPQELAEEGGSKLLKWAISALEEGGEEMMQKFVNEVVTKVAYDNDAEILNWKDYLREGGLGTMAGMGVGGGQIAVQSAMNSVYEANNSKLTLNEQAVVDKVVENEIKQREENGEKLTKKDKAELYDGVLQMMEKGQISTDTIEEVLGGESYDAYKEMLDNETALTKEQEALENEYKALQEKENKTLAEESRIEELRKQFQDNKAKLDDTQIKAKQNELKAQLGLEVADKVKNDRLMESYFEKDKRSQTYQADLNQYDENQRKTIQSAIDSGILNNTRRTHEFVDLIAKVSADKGVPFNFTDNAKLKESGFAVNGKTVNGYVTKDGVTLNINSSKALNTVVGHEITHILEGTEFYNTLQTTLFEYAKSKGDYQGRYDALTELYKNIADADVNAELTADLVGDYLFTDSDFINNLSTKHRNIFEKIYDEIKYLCKVTTAGSQEARELERVKKAFEDAYRADSKTESNTKYSIGEIIDDSNNSYGIGVHLDSTLLDNLTPDERKVMVKERIKELGGEVFTAYDNNGNAVAITIAKPSASFKNENGKRRLVNNDLTTKYIGNEVKQEAVVLIDELITTSKFQGTDPAKHTHGWLDNNGQNEWDVWTTYIQDKNNTIWEATLHIANTANGEKIIYDVVPTKKVGQSGNSDTSLLNNKVTQDGANVKGQFSLSEIPLDQRLSGDALLDAEDLIAEIESVAEVSPNGYVTVYHRTTEENAKRIMENGKMSAKEDGIFFSTQKDGEYSADYGKGVVELKVPVEKLVLDDIFDTEAHLRIPLKNRNEVLDVSAYMPMQHSLSDEGEHPTKYGNYNVYGEDIMLDQQEDIAPIENSVQNVQENAMSDTPVIEKPIEEAEEVPVAEETEMFPDDLAPMAEEVANEQQSENFESLDDADAPMESVTEYDQMADTVSLPKNAVSEIAKEVRTTLGLKNNEMADVYRMIEEYSQGEYHSREQLFRDIKDKFGTRTEKIVNDEAQDVKSYLHSYRISVSDSIKNEIADYGDLQRRNRGRIIFSRNGMPVDSAYQELHENYPQFFPESIYNPTDQLLHILDVANMDKYTENSYRIDDETLWGVTDDIIDYINDVKYTENEKFANQESREAFDSLMKDFITSENQQPTPIEDAPIAEVSNTKGVVDGQQAFVPDAVAPESLTRKELHRGIVEEAKARFAEKGLDLDDVLNNAKDLSTFATVDNTPQRVMEKALGYKEGGVLADLTVNKVAQNETEGIKWLNSFTDRKNGLLAQISKQYNIKPGSKQSAAAQMYAEGFYVDENNNIVQYGDTELAKDFPDATVQKNIKGLASDPRIRQIYDDTLAMINESRARNAYPEIPRLDNYFLHFRAMEDTFSRLGLPFNPNDIRAKDLPTDLNGVTADLKPGQPYFASAMHRTGKRTSFDLLGGLEKYLTSAKNQIYHIDDIQTLRALRNYIADTYGQANGLEGLDALTEEEAQERIKQVYNSHLSTFAKFLNEEANVLAGKTSLIDRGLEGIIGRRGITFLDNVNKQVGSNMVGFNISSSLTNILPVVQTFAKTNKADFVKAFAQTTANKVGSIFGRSDGFTENSSVAIRRKGADRFHRTLWQKIGDPGYALMGAVDNISTELIARTKYNELTRKGMDSQQAHYETDKWVSRLMGDRSLGQQPQLYNSKMLGLFTKFQLEVRNQLDSQFYDTIQEANASTEDIQNGLARNAKKAAKITSTFVQLAVAQHLFGMAFESVAGYNPAFDIIDVITKMFGWDDDEDSEDTVLDNIEEGFLALLGDLPYTSTLTGGRIPIESALPIEELIMGKDEYGNEKSRLDTLGEIAPYYLMPGGYGQVKKTMQGLSMFDEDHPIAGSYTDSGKLRFPVEDTLLNRVQAGIFGQWANENAKDYFDNERDALNDKQIQEFIDSDMSIQDYWDYREGLSGLNTLAEKADYINSLDLTTEQKNLLINNIAQRKEAIDMSDYDDYGSFEEFDYAKQNPEKYSFFKKNNVSYEQYKSFSEDAKDAWNWAYENPEKFEMSKAVTDNVVQYRRYTKALYDLKADKDENGKSITGSRKEKVIDYLNNLDLDYGAKLILFKSEYEADDTYNMEIIEYLNSRNDISYKQMESILKELGFRVDAQGNIWWD